MAQMIMDIHNFRSPALEWITRMLWATVNYWSLWRRPSQLWHHTLHRHTPPVEEDINYHWAAPVAELLRPLIFTALNRLSSHRCGFEPHSSHMRQAMFCLRAVRCFFLGISRFCPTLWLTQLKMSEIILMGRKTQIKKKKKKIITV